MELRRAPNPISNSLIKLSKMKKEWETPVEKLYNAKAEKAKAQKFKVAETKRVMEACKKEDEKWRQAEEEGGRKMTKKREDQAKKRAEAVTRKAVNRFLADQEQPRDKDAEKRRMEDLDRAKKLKEDRDRMRKNTKVVREIDYVKTLSLPLKLFFSRENSTSSESLPPQTAQITSY